MRRFYLTDTNEEVKIGTVIKRMGTINTFFGPTKVEHQITVNESTIPTLIECNIIKAVDDPTTKKDLPPHITDLAFYMKVIADKMHCSPDIIVNNMAALEDVYPSIVFNIILREIAIELDKQYPDHISESDKIYVVSSLDGRITEANKAHIKNYRNFAAFRSIEDARIACRTTRHLLRKMYKNA